jgi:putative chitinase
VNASQLGVVMPHAPMAWLIALAYEMPLWNIDTPAREAAFVGTVKVESLDLTHMEENLHYKNEARVRAMFKRHFIEISDDDVRGYMESPEMFASRIYANRMGNGPEATGDGWRFRGRGPIERTGRDAYKEDGIALNCDLLTYPESLAKVPKLGCASACRFFMMRGCNELADRGDIRGVRHKVNGGEFGLEEVIHATSDALRVMAT